MSELQLQQELAALIARHGLKHARGRADLHPCRQILFGAGD